MANQPDQFAGELCGPGSLQSLGASGGSGWDFFTNFGSYMPRVHCMQTASGEPDWPWIAGLLSLLGVVTAGYLRIFWFWRKSYLAEQPEDRNHKLMQLAWIFLLCAICGYVTSAVMFVWPAYRLVVLILIALAFWTWKFAWNLDAFSLSLRAKRLERELGESLAQRTAELEELVAERTAELERARAEADDANRAKSAFLANMSHEIRSPVAAIMGFAELALEHDTAPRDRDEHLRTIQRNSQHLVSLISEILDLSRIEADQLVIDRVPASIRQIADDVAAIERLHAERGRVGFVLAIDASVPERVLIDPTRVRQVLANLCHNAVKFTHRGSVEVSLTADEPGALVITVTDSGIGMEPEELERVFEPFAQADVSTTRRYGGTGLGLSICRRLVELMGGTLEAKSERYVGTTMRVRLPAPSVEGGENPGPADQAQRAGLEGLRVLIVDDGVDNQRLLSFHCVRAGAEVEIVDNGEAGVLAVSLAERMGAPFDLVLMDMQMPLLDGYAATRRIRRQGLAAAVLAVTANATVEDEARCMLAGCDGYLAKPFRAGQLLEAARRAIAARAQADEAGGRAA